MSDNALILFAHALAECSGSILRARFRTPMAREIKADNSPVTVADKEVEAALSAMIKQQFPDHGIIGEEHGDYQSKARYQWIIDPIDGTRAFIAGIPTFTTLIALADNGIPLLGLIDQPISKERWLGVSGNHTTYNDHRITTRQDARLSTSITGTTSTYYFTAEDASIFARLQKKCGSVILGGDAYAYAMLASGHIDMVIDAGMKPYDFCALAPVITGAGGIITDWDGNALTASSNGKVIACANQALHSEALEILRE